MGRLSPPRFCFQLFAQFWAEKCNSVSRLTRTARVLHPSACHRPRVARAAVRRTLGSITCNPERRHRMKKHLAIVAAAALTLGGVSVTWGQDKDLSDKTKDAAQDVR